MKWIAPLAGNIRNMPRRVIDEFAAKLEALANKYSTTFADVERQIDETERTLSGLLDELTGNEFDMKGLAEFKSLLGGE